MNKLLFAFTALLLFAGSEAQSQVSVAAACSTQSLPVGYNTGNLIVQQNGDLCTNASGGGGGGASATAAAQGTVPVVAGTNKPVAIDLFSSTSVLVKDTTGTPIDWSAPVPVTDNGGSLTVDVGTALPTGTNNIGDVDVLSLPALPAGTNNIGDVDVASIAAGNNNIGDVDVASLPALPTGANTIGTVNLGTLNGLSVAQGSTTAGQTGTLIQCAATTSAPTNVTGQTHPLSCTAASGLLRVGLFNSSGNQVSTNGLSADGQNGATGLNIWSQGAVFNGSQWDRMRGNTTGTATLPYGTRSNRWSYAAASGGILNTTTAVTIKAAAGAGFRNCITGLDFSSDPTLTNATELAVRDGAGGTVLWRTKIGTSGAFHTNISLEGGVCGSDNTLLEVVTLTASGTGAVFFNSRGNIEPN